MWWDSKKDVADLEAEGVEIVVRFTRTTPEGSYSDALRFSAADFAALKEEEIERAKEERAENWARSVREAKKRVPEKPTKEQLVEEIAMLEAQAVEIERRKEAAARRIETGDHKLAPTEEPEEPPTKGAAVTRR